MGFMDAVKKCFQNYATFTGRARRSEYWYFVLFNILVSCVLGALGRMAGDGFLGTVFSGVSYLYSLAAFIPGLAVAWRRLHDIGRSGGYWFFVLIPLVGPIILLVWLAKAGDAGDNAYGPDPKAAENGYYQA